MRYVRMEHIGGKGIHSGGEIMTDDFNEYRNSLPWQFGEGFASSFFLRIPNGMNTPNFRFAIREDLFFQYFTPERLAFLRWEYYVVRFFDDVDHIFGDGQALVHCTRIMGEPLPLSEYLERHWAVAA